MKNTLPTRVFDDELTLKVGDKDVLLHVPGNCTIFTGDILFVEGNPVLWAGPIDNWVAACDQILAWNVDIKSEVRKRFDAGMPVFAAARDIALGRFAGWGDSERMVVNVASLYREFGSTQEFDVLQLFGEMGRFHAKLKAKRATHAHAH